MNSLGFACRRQTSYLMLERHFEWETFRAITFPLSPILQSRCPQEMLGPANSSGSNPDAYFSAKSIVS